MKPTLVVMAAGVGSRFGGLKQIAPVGPSGEIMLDYSVFDAIRAGFGKVVFVIRKDIEKDFKSVIGKHFQGRIPVEYVYQELGNLPPGFAVPPDRTKPWGTGHAIMQGKGTVKEPFAVINADDFYGKESYAIISAALQQLTPDSVDFVMVGFRLMNTLSDHGHVTRGICETGPGNKLVSVVERMKIEKTQSGARFEDENGKWVVATGEEIASMNMFGFTPVLFEQMDRMFPAFLKDAADKPKLEFLLPSIIHELIKSGKITLKVLETPEKWFGVTYKEDTPVVTSGIRRLVDSGVYPSPLWG